MIVPSALDITPHAGIPISLYALINGIPECAFFGVAKAGEDAACPDIWTQAQRNALSAYLDDAQLKIERQLNYPLSPKWFVAEESIYRPRLNLKWGMVTCIGQQAWAGVATATPVNHAADPATITISVPAGTYAAGAENDMHIFHPNSDYEVQASSVVFNAGGVNDTYVFSIPRCRLVKPAFWNNGISGLDYTDLNNFADELDVRLESCDTTTQATLLGHDCSCIESSSRACVYIRNSYLGTIDVIPICSCPPGDKLSVNYQAGLQVLDSATADLIIRLAHTLMPNPICGCRGIKALWERDRNTPTNYTPEREACPFGLSDGAWFVWNAISDMVLYRSASI